MDLRTWLTNGVDAIEQWQATFGPFERDASLQISDERFARAFSTFMNGSARTTRSSTRPMQVRCSSPRTLPRWSGI